MIPKAVMDFTVTPMLSSLLSSHLGLMGRLIVLGVYAGLRTGFLECGFTYLAVDRTRLRGASLDESTAFGVGFGATEAILLGLPSLIQMTMFLVNPSLIDSIPPEFKEALQAQLNTSIWAVPAPILERMFTMFVHLFTSLLVFTSIQRERVYLFLYAVIYKSVLDAAVPFMQWCLSMEFSLKTLYITEIWVVVMGMGALQETIRMRKNWGCKH